MATGVGAQDINKPRFPYSAMLSRIGPAPFNNEFLSMEISNENK